MTFFSMFQRQRQRCKYAMISAENNIRAIPYVAHFSKLVVDFLAETETH